MIVHFEKEGLVIPPQDQVLNGISCSAVLEIAKELGMSCAERPLRAEDVAAADEVMLSSTPFCLLPVTHWNRAMIGDGRPGKVFRQLIDAWSENVGVDIIEQARKLAVR